MPGCIATLANVIPRSVKASLTTSYAPALTPPEVRTRSTGSSARGREGLVEGPEELLDVVGHEAQELGDRTRVGHRRGEHRAVRLVDLAVAQRLARGDELGAGGEHQHPRPAAHRERPGADGRGEPDLGGAEHRARGQHDLARGDVLARDPHVLPGGDRPVDRAPARCRRPSTRPAPPRPRRPASRRRS